MCTLLRPSSPCSSSQDPRDRCLCLPGSVAPGSHNCPGLSHTGKPDRLHPCSRCDVEASGWSSWVRNPSMDSQLWPESGWRTQRLSAGVPSGVCCSQRCVFPAPTPLPCLGPGTGVRRLWLRFWVRVWPPLLLSSHRPCPTSWLSVCLCWYLPSLLLQPRPLPWTPAAHGQPTDVSGRLRRPGLPKPAPLTRGGSAS